VLHLFTKRTGPGPDELHVSPIAGRAMLAEEEVREITMLRERIVYGDPPESEDRLRRRPRSQPAAPRSLRAAPAAEEQPPLSPQRWGARRRNAPERQRSFAGVEDHPGDQALADPFAHALESTEIGDQDAWRSGSVATKVSNRALAP
jgi:hypothetical protein